MSVDAAVFWAAAAAGAVPVLRETLRKPMTEEVRRAAPGAFLDLPQGRTHYCWLGRQRGPIAVCVHGLTTPSFVWRGLARQLGTLGFRVLIYDLYGRGYSDRPREANTPAFFVKQLHDVLAALDIDGDITLFGYSMGGVIASGFAAKYPSMMRRLVLIAPAGMQTDLGRTAKFATEWPVIGDWAFHMAYPSVLKRGYRAERDVEKSVERLEDMQLAELSYRGYLRSVLSSLRYTLRHPIPAIHRQVAQNGVPVAAVWGRDDTVIPIAGLGQLAQWNRNAQQEVIEGAGHGLVYTHTEELGDAIARLTGLRD